MARNSGRIGAVMQVILRIPSVVECTVIERKTRFTVLVDAGGSRLEAHLNNTGRLVGILEPGRRAYCTPKKGGKTRLRLHAIECPRYPGRAALLDTRLQMRAFEESVSQGVIPWLAGCRVAAREPSLGGLRLDYLLSCPEGYVYVEIKSAVLRLPSGEASYPDPKSLRGRRHVEALIKQARRGRRSLLVFMAAIPSPSGFRVNAAADPLLPGLLSAAVGAGVGIRAVAVHYRVHDRVVVLEDPDLPVALY